MSCRPLRWWLWLFAQALLPTPFIDFLLFFQLTDQEAAADEAIERLCLRCHNLETRLAEKEEQERLANASVNTSATDGEMLHNGGGRLSPVFEQQDETDADSELPEQQQQQPTNTGNPLTDLQNKYASLSALYEDAIKRWAWTPKLTDFWILKMKKMLKFSQKFLFLFFV